MPAGMCVSVCGWSGQKFMQGLAIAFPGGLSAFSSFFFLASANLNLSQSTFHRKLYAIDGLEVAKGTNLARS